MFHDVVGRLAGWLTDWLAGWLAGCLAGWLSRLKMIVFSFCKFF